MTILERPIALGRSELREVVADGATAMVWRGEHRTSGTPVAVKVMASETLEQIGGMPGFRRGVQAQARLTHPGIAAVFDYGTVEPEAAEQSEGHLEAEAPYLVMEYARDGTLAGSLLPQDFAWLREILLAVLRTLAHAHARNLVHRDLKPANILRFSDRNGAGRWKLTDFGFALQMRDLAIDDLPGAAATAGTPHYMAPEQLEGHWRYFGPWTDLYQIGCIAYELVCGRTPYQGTTFSEIATGHLYEKVPSLDPRFPLPDGFEEWVHRLMAEAPADRFARAADAARELAALPVPEAPEPQTGDGRGAAQLLERQRPESTLEAPLAGHPPTETPFLERLKRPEGIPRTTGFPEIGLALVGLRERGLADREEVYGRLWSALETVIADRDTRCLVVDAPSGLGKTHLVEAFGRRVDELGIGTVLEAHHHGGSTGGSDLAGLVRRWARAQNLDRRQLEDLLDFHLGRCVSDRSDRADLLAGLAELLDPDPDTDESGARESPASDERFALVERLLGRLADERPLVLVLDDLHRGPESAALVEWLLEAYDSPPVLIVATTASDSAIGSASTGRRLERIRDHDRTWHLELGPLERTDQFDLVESLLPLTREAVEHVVERTEGHPLFAVQLVQDWADRELLARTGRGFDFAARTPPDIAASLVDLWMQRVRGALEGLAERERETALEALELAAVLGRQFSGDELRHALEHAGLEYPEKLFEQVLIDRGLLEREFEDWQFTHRLLVESLEAHADRADRLVDHHRRCAEAIDELHTEGAPTDTVRLARHLRASDQTEAALEPMMAAARAYRRRSGMYDHAHDLLEEHADWLDSCQLSETDPRRLANCLERAWTLVHRGDLHVARRLARRAASGAREVGRTADAAEAHMLMARIAYDRGELGEIGAHLRNAEGDFRAADDVQGMTRCLRFRAALARRQRRYEDARRLLENVQRRYADQEDAVGQAWCDWGIARSWIQEGEFDRAGAVAEQLVDTIASLDSQPLSAAVHNLMGDIARSREDWEAAVDHFEAAGDLWRRVGSKDQLVAELNVGSTQIEAQDWEAAEGTLKTLRYRLEVAGLQAIRPHVTSGLAACAAHRRDWPTVREQLASMTSDDGAMTDPEPDVVKMIETAARQCRDGEEPELADELEALIDDA